MKHTYPTAPRIQQSKIKILISKLCTIAIGVKIMVMKKRQQK